MIVELRPAVKKRPPYGRRIVAVLLILIFVAGLGNYLRAVPLATATPLAVQTIPAKTVSLNWPGFGQAAVMTAEDGLLGTSGNQTPVATASIAKVITSLLILQKYPLKLGEQGPTVTLNNADVAIYNNYVSKGGSVAAVALGEKITEYQLLEGMLLPSANNLADTAAIWAYGSLPNYLTAANTYVQQHDMTSTTVAIDASGFDSSTTSTATDLAKLGLLALQEPVLKQIARQNQTTLPVAGTVANYNQLLGVNGIFGLKTGNNDTDLGAFLFAANISIGDQTQTIVGAVMGANSLRQAMQSSLPLITSVASGYETVTITPGGTTVGRYRVPWLAGSVAAKTKTTLTMLHWKAQPVLVHYTLNSIKAGAGQGAVVGQAIAHSSTRTAKQSIVLAQGLPEPTPVWRLTRH